MKSDKTYDLLVAKMNELAVVPPQELGPLTPVYKKTTSFFKNQPVKITFLLAAFFSLFMYLLLGARLVRLVSILQFGF